MITITEATLIDDLDDDVYHSGGVKTPGPQLSQSLLKLLVPPSTPAHFQWRVTHPQPNKRVFDVGRAAHTMMLGAGQPMAACPKEHLSTNGQMSTKDAKAWEAEQRANGIVPLTPKDYDMVHRMVDALLANERVAEIITDPGKRPEVSAFAQHPDAPVWFRGRFDLLGGQLWDYKTSKSANPDDFRRSAYTFGYHVQDVLYRTLAEVITGAVQAPMNFIVQEKEPPYLVSTVTLTAEFEALARAQIAAALDLYLACVDRYGPPQEATAWPGYPDELIPLDPPTWALNQLYTAEAEAAAAEIDTYLQGAAS